MNNYTYNATITRWIDADTVDVNVDLGFTVHTKIRVRLADIDAPERFTPEGEAATAHVNNAWPIGSPVQLRSVGRGKYGRWIGNLYTENTEINASIVSAGHATKYPA